MTMSVLITASRARVPDVHSTRVEEFKMVHKGTEISTLGHCYGVEDPEFLAGGESQLSIKQKILLKMHENERNGTGGRHVGSIASAPLGRHSQHEKSWIHPC